MTPIEEIVREIQNIVELGGRARRDDPSWWRQKNPYTNGSYSSHSIEARAWQYGYDNRVRCIRFAIHDGAASGFVPCPSISRLGWECDAPLGHAGVHLNHGFSPGGGMLVRTWTTEQESISSGMAPQYRPYWPGHPVNVTMYMGHPVHVDVHYFETG